MGIDDVFAVIAEGTRRQILERLRDGDRAVGELVVELQVSQPTVSKHLKVLREAGLVTMRAQGQRRYYALDTEPLNHVRAWLDRFPAPVDAEATAAESAGAPTGYPAGTAGAEDGPGDGTTDGGPPLVAAGDGVVQEQPGGPIEPVEPVQPAEPAPDLLAAAVLAGPVAGTAGGAAAGTAAGVHPGVPSASGSASGSGPGPDSSRPIGRTMGRAAERAADLLSQFRRRRDPSS